MWGHQAGCVYLTSRQTDSFIHFDKRWSRTPREFQLNVRFARPPSALPLSLQTIRLPTLTLFTLKGGVFQRGHWLAKLTCQSEGGKRSIGKLAKSLIRHHQFMGPSARKISVRVKHGILLCAYHITCLAQKHLWKLVYVHRRRNKKCKNQSNRLSFLSEALQTGKKERKIFLLWGIFAIKGFFPYFQPVVWRGLWGCRGGR